MRPHNLPLVLLGAGLLWFGWFRFNAGSALGANGLAALAFINTVVATAAGLVAWLVVERMRDGHATTLGRRCAVRDGRRAEVPLRLRRLPRRRRVHLVGGVVGSLLIGLLATQAATGEGAPRDCCTPGASACSSSSSSRW